MKLLTRTFVLVPLLGALAWSALTLDFTLPGPAWVGHGAALVFLLATLLALVALRPFARGVAVALGGFALVLVWFFSLEPSNSGDWQPDVGQLAHGEVNGDILTLHNVRDFTYRSETDFTEHWVTKTLDLSQLDGLDIFMSSWGAPGILHTIMSWDFADGQHLAISIETRKVVGQQYSAVLGFFRQYPIYYVAAEERDLIGVRTNFRGEHVDLFPLRTPPENARALLLDYVKSMNGLVEKPEWYNALVDNCTTTIQRHVRDVNPNGPGFDWRMLANGRLPELLYERGSIDTSMPLADLLARSNVDERAKASGLGPDFSARIRAGVPSPR